MIKKSLHCPACGSADFLADVGATWDVERQEFVVVTNFDICTCNTCATDFDKPEERILAEEGTNN